MRLSTILLFALLLSAFTNAQQNTFAFIEKGSEWKYYDKLSYPGDDWLKNKFNDESWKSGLAELGYGDNDEKTAISHGDKNDGKHLAAYFRKTFEITDLEKYETVELKIKRDDGAVVYINGKEVFRTNMPQGKVTMETPASSALSGGNENMYVSAFLEKSIFTNGKNYIAVEVHQDNPGSSDLSFDLSIVGSTQIAVVRGPYLQSGTPNSMIVRWRTSKPAIAKINYGTTINLTDSIVEKEPLTDHIFKVSGLKPYTKYFYSASTVNDYAVYDSTIYFITPPEEGKSIPVRIWAMGDFGNTGNDQIAVRDAYYTYSANMYTNLLLWLGDNAYPKGTDDEYGTNVFTPYKKILAQSLVYSTTGNHDMFFSNPTNETGTYFDIFSFPKNGECGGIKSGSEAYYSFNYGDIHFICLESNIDSFKTRTDEMINWLKADLDANKSKWTIAYFHYAPYSKGYHNSDVNKTMIWMRENIVPILEEYKTDLVLAGHLHDYERTFLLNGHYGLSSTLKKSMIVDRGKGTDPVVYSKKSKGTMYVIAGCMGDIQPVNKNWPHPANAKSFQKIFGSLILDIIGNKLEGRLITKDGKMQDHFVIEK